MTDCLAALVEFEDPETGRKAIYSAGKCSNRSQDAKENNRGQLGQGHNISESRDFKKLGIDSDRVQLVDLSVGANQVIAYDSEGKIWAWGKNDNHMLGLSNIDEIGIVKPLELYPLNNLKMKPLKISVGKNHSLILFENEKKK